MRALAYGCLAIATYVGATACLASPDAPERPSVGDTVAGGKVVEVTPAGQTLDGSDCFAVTVEREPAWQCSSAQLDELKATPGGPADLGDAEQPAPADLVKLQAVDCEGLANLRRPA